MRRHSSSPDRSGITQSIITRSGLCSSKSLIASSPVFAKIILYCFCASGSSTSLRETGESSMTKTWKSLHFGFMGPSDENQFSFLEVE